MNLWLSLKNTSCEAEILNILERIKGMYAGAFFDGEKLYLFRDIVGQKPLYYFLTNDTVFFSSDIAYLRVSKDSKQL